MEDLGADGLVNSEATGINASGQVVGTASASTSMAFLWTSTDGMLNLGTLGGNSATPRESMIWAMSSDFPPPR